MYEAYTDASLKGDSAGIGYVIFKNKIPIASCRKQHEARNSTDLEYIAVKDLLERINELEIKNIKIYTDSKSLTDKLDLIGSEKKIKNEHIKGILYWLKINPTVKIDWISRNKNKYAHKLSREAMSGLKDAWDSTKLMIIKDSQRAIETKMVVRHRPNIILKCFTCKEPKAATDFPRFRNGKKKRSCNVCEKKLNMINCEYIRVKNTY